MGDPEDLRVILERLDERTNDTNERVKQIEHAVFHGNGTPPLVARVTALEASSTTTRWIIGIVATLSSAVGGLVAYFFHSIR